MIQSAYILYFAFIKLIKLYIESEVQHITTAEYSIEIVPLRLIMLLMLLNLTKLVKFTYNTIDMGTKYYQKSPMFNKVRCWVLIRK